MNTSRTEREGDFSVRFGCQKNPDFLGSGGRRNRTSAAIAVTTALLDEDSPRDQDLATFQRFPRETKLGREFIARSGQGPTADLRMDLIDYLNRK